MRRAALLPLAAVLSGCVSTGAGKAVDRSTIEVLTPVDAVPVRTQEILVAAIDPTERRDATLRALREVLVGSLHEAGASVCGGELALPSGTLPPAPELAARGRDDGVDVVIVTELLAYGEVRRSWLWFLLAQGFVAGVGHGVVVAEATGSASLGWLAGAGEFVLETITWVGGTLFASHIVDPVVVRLTAVRARDGIVIGTWTREGTSPPKTWLHRDGLPPRDQRLLSIAGRIFAAAAPKVLARIAVWQRPFQPRA